MGVSDENRALVSRVLSGDTRAFEAIISEYKGLVFHVVRSMVHGHVQQEDLAQDVFIRVYEGLPQFRFDCALATWISTIAFNMCLNHLRRSKSRPQESLDRRTGLEVLDEGELTDNEYMIELSYPTPHAVICQKEITAAVTGAVERLPILYRLVITLHYLEGFALPDLAQSLEIPVGTIKSHLFRARAMLKSDLLQKYTIEDLLK